MNPLPVILTLLIAQSASSEYEDEKLATKLELIDIDLEEECEDLTRSQRGILLNEPDAYSNRINELLDYGKYMRHTSASLLQLQPTEDLYPLELMRNLTLLIKSGDTLLHEEDWKHLVNFHTTTRKLDDKMSLPCPYNTLDCWLTKKDIETTLAISRNVTKLEETWKAWPEIYDESLVDQYPNILQITNKAATQNNKYNTRQYWEMLVEYEDIYETVNTLWSETEELYTQFYNFVLLRINRYYGTNYTEIPPFLLGSLYADDWSNIADIVLIRPQLLHDINMELKEMSVKDVYKLAEKVPKHIGLGKFGKQFWVNSKFDTDDCNPQILNYCAHQFSEVITCKDVNWVNYLNAHEVAMEVALSKQDFPFLLRQKLRQSAFDEAFKALGSTLAISNLPFNNILDRDVFKFEDAKTTNKIMALFLVALRVLPKIPYYIAADLWRLEEIENPSEDLVIKWWEIRNKYQRLQVPGNFSDFLGDPYVISNQPYISKILGLYLQFQILDYYQISLFTEGVNVLDIIKDDSTFVSTIKDRSNKDAKTLLDYNFAISEISSYSLLQFFQPLLEYMQEPPLDQEPIVKRDRKQTTQSSISEKPLLALQNVPQQVGESNRQDLPQADDNKADVSENSSEEEEYEPISPKKANSYIFLGVIGGIIVLTLAYGLIMHCRKKVGTNNRRFDA